MKTFGSAQSTVNSLESRCHDILTQHESAIRTRTDRAFALLLMLEYILSIAVEASFSSLRTSGSSLSQIFTAASIGGMILAFPISLVYRYPSRSVTRHVIAVAQILYSVRLSQTFGIGVETPFHIFGTFALLAFYRDWRVLITAGVAATADHLIFRLHDPLLLSGISSPMNLIGREDVCWLLVENLFLIWLCHHSTREWKSMAQHRALLEFTNEVIEVDVRNRIAELANSERELVRSQNAIRAIVDTAPDGILTMTASGRIESVNTAAERLFGYLKVELIGQNISLIIQRPPEAESDPYGQLDSSCGIPQIMGIDCELVGRRRGGSTFPIDVAISEVQTDGVRRFTGIVRDITVRKLAEINLEEQARLAELAAKIGHVLVSPGAIEAALHGCADATASHLDATFVGIWIFNNSTRRLQLAASAKQFSGCQGDPFQENRISIEIEMIARERITYQSDDIAADPRIEKATWLKREAVTGFAGYPLVVENRLVGVMAMYHRRPFTGGTFRKIGSVTKSIALAIERANSEMMLKEAMTAAARASAAKSQFLANMSHELRTPMNAIIGYSEMLVEEYQDLGQTDFLPDIMKIRSAGTHLLQLINDILDVSKIESGKMEITAETLEVTPFLQEVVETLRPTIERNGNRFHVESDLPGAKIYSDSTKIRQILFNLLSNAAKFTKGGTVTLRVHLLSYEDQPRLNLEVSDSGIGMTEEQMSRICEPFMQAESSTTRRFGGTGLGLAITKRFCEMLGGHLTIRSAPAIGSTFVASIPAQFNGMANGSNPGEARPVTLSTMESFDERAVDHDEYALTLYARANVECLS